MTDQGPGSAPPQIPQQQYPQQPYAQQQPAAPGLVPPVYPGVNPHTPPPKRSRAWIWWTIGIAVVLLAIVGSCALPFILLFSSGGGPSSGGFGEAVGVIHVDGVIAGTGDGIDGYVTPEAFRDQLEQVEDDSSVKALVLRVDSPGGTVAASEEIAEYVKAFKKPIVVSIGDVGASGAYMISSQSDEIWAMPGSAVGSIGVISEIPNVSGLLDNVGVEFQVITAGKYKDAGSPYRSLSKEERALIQGEVDEAYDQFVGIVAEGRKMPRSKVESLATGWAWNGERARELGLVDEIGTYDQALDAAAKLGGIDGDDYEVIVFDDEFGQLFGSVLGVVRRLDGLAALSDGRATAVRQALPK